MATIFGLNIKLRNEHWPRAESFYHYYSHFCSSLLEWFNSCYGYYITRVIDFAVVIIIIVIIIILYNYCYYIVFAVRFPYCYCCLLLL